MCRCKVNIKDPLCLIYSWRTNRSIHHLCKTARDRERWGQRKERRKGWKDVNRCNSRFADMHEGNTETLCRALNVAQWWFCTGGTQMGPLLGPELVNESQWGGVERADIMNQTALWQRNIEVPSMPFSIMARCPSGRWSCGLTQTWQPSAVPRVKLSKHWKWIIIFSHCGWKTTIRPNEEPRGDLLWALINGAECVWWLFTLFNLFQKTLQKLEVKSIEWKKLVWVMKLSRTQSVDRSQLSQVEGQRSCLSGWERILGLVGSVRV